MTEDTIDIIIDFLEEEDNDKIFEIETRDIVHYQEDDKPSSLVINDLITQEIWDLPSEGETPLDITAADIYNNWERNKFRT